MKGQTIPLHVDQQTYPSRFIAGNPAPTASLTQAEQNLGHRLPNDLKTFLSRWNGAELYAEEIGGGVRVYSIDVLIEENRTNYRFQYESHDVLIIGKLDCEIDLFLDLRRPNDSEWSVYWADVGESIEEALSREPLAQSFQDFIKRLISRQGEPFWAEFDFIPSWQAEPPDLWRYGFGFFVLRERHPRLMIRIGIHNSPSVSPKVVRILAGIIQFLKKRNATPVLPQTVGRNPGGGEDIYEVSENVWAAFDPKAIPPVQLPKTGWIEVATGMWLHGPKEAACYVRRGYDFDGKLISVKVMLSWAEPTAREVADTVRRRLEALASSLDRSNHVADGYEAIVASWWLVGTKGKGNPTWFEP